MLREILPLSEPNLAPTYIVKGHWISEYHVVPPKNSSANLNTNSFNELGKSKSETIKEIFIFIVLLKNL